MPIIYQHQPDEAITWQTIAFDEDGDWWSGVQKCGAAIAVSVLFAASLSAASVARQPYSYHQDEIPTTPPTFIPDEDYYQNQIVLSKVISLSAQQDTNDFTSPKLDEDYWLGGNLIYVQPIIAPQQWIFETGDIVAQPISFTPDEHYWITGIIAVPSLSILQQWTYETGDIVPQPAPGSLLARLMLLGAG